MQSIYLCHITTILHKMLKRLQKANKIIVYFISMASYKHLTLSFFNMAMTMIHIKTAPKMRPFMTPLTVAALFSSSTRARQTKVQEVVDKLKSGETKKGYATGVLSKLPIIFLPPDLLYMYIYSHVKLSFWSADTHTHFSILLCHPRNLLICVKGWGPGSHRHFYITFSHSFSTACCCS